MVLGNIWQGWLQIWRDVGFTGTPTPPKETKNIELSRQSWKPINKRLLTVTPVKSVYVKSVKSVKNENKKKKNAKYSEKLTEKVEPEEVWPNNNEVPQLSEADLETPKERVRRIEAKKKKEKLRLFQSPDVSGKRRQLLYLNPGTEKVHLLKIALKRGTELPKFALKVGKEHFELIGNKVYFEGLPVLTQEEKADAVRMLYYDPKEPSTIYPILDKLRLMIANISKNNVRHILRTFETYQLNFRRRRPPKVAGRMILTAPGVILCDAFYPQKVNGWKPYPCLTLMDAWSRFTRCYVLQGGKGKKNQIAAAKKFFQEFTSLGQWPRYVLMDKGTDISGVKEVIELYRRKPNDQLVFHSKTGQPVNLVEQTQAQIQRRMQVFRTAGLTNDPREILEDITDSMNNQRRPLKGNMTPLQLLTLSKKQRSQLNLEHGQKTEEPEVKGLKPLFKGSRVRVLLMTHKEQVTNSKKGFTEKWSRDVYTVKKKIAIRGNKLNFKYWVHGDSDFYYRHELLKLPGKLDDEILDLIHTKLEDEGVNEEAYDPMED